MSSMVVTGNEPGRGGAPWAQADRVVDLSLTLAEDLPCSWPGAARYRHDPDHWYADVEGPPPLRQWSGHPYCSFTLGLDEHTGTHFDAPTHFIPHPDSGLPNAGPAGLLSTEAIEPRQMMGNAVVIDVRELVGSGSGGVSPRIEPALLAAHEERSGPIASSDVVLFRSGWDERYRRGAAGDRYVLEPLVRRSEPAWPAPSPAAIEWLLQRGVRCLGTDGVSMGPADDGVPTHLVGLGAGMVFVEGLASLGELPSRGAGFIFLPVKVRGGTGGPGRAVAFV